MAAARALAHAMHAHSARLVYGGGTGGLMGELARTLVELSGPQAVHGIIPAALVQFERKGKGSSDGPKARPTGDDSDVPGDVAEDSLDNGLLPEERLFGRTTVVPDMHTRKRLMAQQVVEGGPGGGFVALSGGFGTLEELMEVVTWNQLGIHDRPVVLFNVDGYYDDIVRWVARSVDAGFVDSGASRIVVEAKAADEVVLALTHYRLADGRLALSWGKNVFDST
ncbi:MAG: hypothetical protein M1825_003909 [Sarcosagium campestre]|nr:MAG: hypothetical protein M1825_003909 [Sarcosagium campestre]